MKETTESGLELSDMEPMFYDEYVTLPTQVFEKIERFICKRMLLISTPDRGRDSALADNRSHQKYPSLYDKKADDAV